MGVRMLGSVAVDRDSGDGPDRGGDKHHDPLEHRDRVVLGVLAMTPHDVVTPERLADALWGDERPSTWKKVLQGSVSRVRKALGADAVRTSRQGYRLDLPDDEIDGPRFEALLHRAGELLRLGEPDRARYAVTQALGLWHGRALAELEGWPPGDAAAEHWEERRRDAEELLVETALAVGGWREVLTEAGRLVADQPYRESRWALLARAQYQAGRQGEALSTLQRARAVLAGDLGLDPGPELASLEQSILRQDATLLPGTGPASGSFACPYRGLLPYDIDHAEQFFGRDAEVTACLDILAGEHVVPVVGPSGSGKSSLARAGIAARLRRQGRKVAVITPGPHPMAALERAGGIGGALVVDQLEEIATLCEDPAERLAFLDALAAHLDTGSDLVLTIRADRLAALSGHRGFAQVLERGIHLLGPMVADDLRSAIEGPARQAGLLLEPGLVDLLVNEITGEPGALPLLSHALVQTWERRESRTLTVAGYRASGGIQGAVARSAEELFLALDERDQRAARTLLLRLVIPVPSGEPTRSRLPRRIVGSDAAQEAIIESLVAARLITSDGETVELAHESLARAWPRLRGWLDADVEGQLILRHLTTTADAWVAMGRPDSELYRGTRLAQVTEWRNSTTPDLTEAEQDFLDAGESLASEEARTAEERLEAQARSNRRLRGLLGGVAAALVVALVAGGVALRERSRATEQADLAAVRELAAASLAVRTADPELAVLLALEATSPELAGDGPVAREAVESLHLALAESRLLMVVEDAGGDVAWSPDGELIATEGPEDSGQIELIDAATGQAAASFAGHDVDINEVEFGPEGRLITTGDDGALRVWDPRSETLLTEVRGRGEVFSPTFSRQGPLRVAAVWAEDGVIRVAAVTDDDEASVTELDVGFVTAADLSPDGDSLVVAQQRDTVRAVVIDTRTGRPLRRLPGSDDGIVVEVDFSPDGRWIAVGYDDGTLRIHRAATGRVLHTIDDARSVVSAVAWSPDSRRLAASENRGAVRVYDLGRDHARSAIQLSTADSAGGVAGLAFSPGGDRLLGGDVSATTARVWDVGLSGDAEVTNVRGAIDAHGIDFDAEGRLFTVAEGTSVAAYHTDRSDDAAALRFSAPYAGEEPDDVGGEFRAVSLSSDGSLVAGGTSPSGIRIWDVASQELLFATPPEAGFLWRPAFHPSGERAAFAGDVRVDIRRIDGELEAQLLAGDEHAFRDPVFSPDGRTVVLMRFPRDRAGPRGWEVLWWDWRSDEVRTSPTVAGFDPAFSPDGTKLIIPAVGAPTRVIDVASGDVAYSLDGHPAGVLSAAFSPDGQQIATGGRDGDTILWDAADGTQLLQLPPSEHPVDTVAFSPDGRHLATDSARTDVVRIWTLDLQELRRIAADQVPRELSPAECQRYLHRACDSA